MGPQGDKGDKTINVTLFDVKALGEKKEPMQESMPAMNKSDSCLLET